MENSMKIINFFLRNLPLVKTLTFSHDIVRSDMKVQRRLTGQRTEDGRRRPCCWPWGWKRRGRKGWKEYSYWRRLWRENGKLIKNHAQFCYFSKCRKSRVLYLRKLWGKINSFPQKGYGGWGRGGYPSIENFRKIIHYVLTVIQRNVRHCENVLV